MSANIYARLTGMSNKTWQEKRKTGAELPIQTDWLWSCPPGMTLDAIARQLGFTNEPRTELSVRAWTDERHLRDDLYRAFAPSISLDQLVPRMVWDAFDDDLRDACDNGYLIVLRDLPTALDAEMPDGAQKLLQIVGSRRRDRGFHFFESRPSAHFALVLDGWPEATIQVRARWNPRYTETERYTVQALNGASSSPSQP